jgi:hypothetical protein
MSEYLPLTERYEEKTPFTEHTGNCTCIGLIHLHPLGMKFGAANTKQSRHRRKRWL